MRRLPTFVRFSGILATIRFVAVHALGLPGWDQVPVRIADQIGREFPVTVDATGSPGGWQAVVAAAQPGATVNLFGGCAPGSLLELDATHVHYDELTILGTYHHRPDSFQEAISHLSRWQDQLDALLTDGFKLERVQEALEAMSNREILKGVIRPLEA